MEEVNIRQHWKIRKGYPGWRPIKIKKRSNGPKWDTFTFQYVYRTIWGWRSVLCKKIVIKIPGHIEYYFPKSCYGAESLIPPLKILPFTFVFHTGMVVRSFLSSQPPFLSKYFTIVFTQKRYSILYLIRSLFFF